MSARYGTGGGNTPIVLNVGQRLVLGEMEERRQGVYPSRNGLQRPSGDTDRYFRSIGFGDYAETGRGGTLTCRGGDTGLGGAAQTVVCRVRPTQLKSDRQQGNDASQCESRRSFGANGISEDER